jgi:hypothetical protein
MDRRFDFANGRVDSRTCKSGDVLLNPERRVLLILSAIYRSNIQQPVHMSHVLSREVVVRSNEFRSGFQLGGSPEITGNRLILFALRNGRASIFLELTADDLPDHFDRCLGHAVISQQTVDFLFHVR